MKIRILFLLTLLCIITSCSSMKPGQRTIASTGLICTNNAVTVKISYDESSNSPLTKKHDVDVTIDYTKNPMVNLNGSVAPKRNFNYESGGHSGMSYDKFYDFRYSEYVEDFSNSDEKIVLLINTGQVSGGKYKKAILEDLTSEFIHILTCRNSK